MLLAALVLRQKMVKLCPILKIMLLWCQQMLCNFQAKRTNSDIMCAYHQLKEVKS